MIIGIILGVIALLLLVLYFLSKLRKKKYETFIQQNSIQLKKVTEINHYFSFYSAENMDQFYTYVNEIFFDSISCRDYLIYELQFIQRKVFEKK